MRSPVDDSSTAEQRRRDLTSPRTPAKIGLTVAALTGAAVLGVIGVRAQVETPAMSGGAFVTSSMC